MAVRYARFVRSELTPAEQAEVDVVDGIAARLEEYLAGHTLEIDGVHVFRASSAKVQDVVGGLLREVGFREEVVHTPPGGFVTRSRADFAYRLGEGRGIIAEIERGGTTTNNHDLKDFWNRHRSRRPPPVTGGGRRLRCRFQKSFRSWLFVVVPPRSISAMMPRPSP